LLYPYRFQYPIRTEANQAKLLPEANGIEFTGPSEIRSKSTNDGFNSTLISGDGLTIEVWMATDDYQQKGPARILSDSFDPYHRNFTLGQERRNLIVRLRTESSDQNGFPETTLANIFLSANPYHIVVTYDYQKMRIYINSREISQTSSYRGKFFNWDSSYPLIFGNENTGGSRPWNGRLFLVAFYKRPLSATEVLQNYRIGRFHRTDGFGEDRRVKDGVIALYSFNEEGGSVIHDNSGYGLDLDLVIPDNILIDDEQQFMKVYAPGPQNIADMLGNIFAFAIFGFLLNRYLRTRGHSSVRTVIWGVTIGVIFSFGSEFIAYFLEARSSSLLDSLSRVSGVALGISIDFYTKHWNEKHRRHISQL
jgi:VanZ family protein